MNESLKSVGLEPEYLETDLELFRIFHCKFYRHLEKQYRPLLKLVVPDHFSWQTTVMWLLTRDIPPDDSTYDYVQRAILTPSLDEKK